MGDIVVENVPRLIEQISCLFLDHKFSDVAFKIDGTELPAHKVILAARSEHFAKFFYDDAQENRIDEINNVSVEALKTLLRYVYTGSTTISSTNTNLMLDVLILAHQKSFPDLETIIIDKLKLSLDVNNVCRIMEVATLYNLEDLLQSCRIFREQHFTEITSAECGDRFDEVEVQ